MLRQLMFSTDISSSTYNGTCRKHVERFTLAKNICELSQTMNELSINYENGYCFSLKLLPLVLLFFKNISENPAILSEVEKNIIFCYTF